jgi:hypothetical protein
LGPPPGYPKAQAFQDYEAGRMLKGSLAFMSQAFRTGFGFYNFSLPFKLHLARFEVNPL